MTKRRKFLIYALAILIGPGVWLTVRIAKLNHFDRLDEWVESHGGHANFQFHSFGVRSTELPEFIRDGPVYKSLRRKRPYAVNLPPHSRFVAPELEILEGLDELSVDFSFTNFDDSHAAVISKNRGIKNLYLQGTSISDQGIRIFSQMQNLECLTVPLCDITDDSIEGIIKISRLTVLDISGSNRITLGGVERILANSPQLKSIIIDDSKFEKHARSLSLRFPSVQIVTDGPAPASPQTWYQGKLHR